MSFLFFTGIRDILYNRKLYNIATWTLILFSVFIYICLNQKASPLSPFPTPSLPPASLSLSLLYPNVKTHKVEQVLPLPLGEDSCPFSGYS